MATSDRLKEHITCSVCLELYTDPHILKCLHSFCMTCLEGIKRNNVVQCPECRMYTDFKDVQKDFKTNSLVDIYREDEPMEGQLITSTSKKSSLKCQMCDDVEKAVFNKCVECDWFMCNDCIEMHKGMDIYKGHHMKSVYSIVEALNKTFVARQKEVGGLQSSIDIKIDDITTAIHNINSSQDKQLSELKQYKQEMTEKIKRHFTEMENTVKSNNGQLLQSLIKSKEICEEMKRSMKSTQVLLSEMVQNEDISTLTDAVHSLDTDVKKQMEDVRSSLCDIDSSLTSNVVVHEGEEFFNPGKYFTVSAEKMVPKGQEFNPKQFLTVCAEKMGSTHNNKLFKKLDYSDLCNKKIVQIKAGHITGVDIPQRIQLINGNIWCAMSFDGVKIYDKECELVKTITHDKLKCCYGLTQNKTGGVIVACTDNHGLHQVSLSGSYQGCIAEGSFSDVCCYGDKLYVLDCVSREIVEYEYECFHGKWSRKTIKQHVKADVWNNLCVNATGLYVSSWDSHSLFVNRLGKWHNTGTMGYGGAGQFVHPMLCDVDSYGNALICDFHNNRLQVYKQAHRQWSVLSVQGELEKPCGAVLSSDVNHMWVVKHKKELIKCAILKQ